MTRITFQRSGGFMGRTINFSVNLDELPASQAATLSSLLAKADFFNLPSNPAKHPVPDEFIYSITIETDQRSHTVHASDTTAPANLGLLLIELSNLARIQRK